MAAAINGNDGKQNIVGKPVLLDKIGGSTDTINAAVLIPRQDAVISVSDDKTMKVWLKRDTGQYWPSICQILPSEVSAVNYSPETRGLFVGQDNGTITEFELTEDYNRIFHRRDYIAHQGRVMAVKFSATHELVLSCSRDKYFMWHCTETGRRLCGFHAPAACLCVAFDEQSKYAFVGDSSGNIHILHLKESSFDVVATLRGHSGSIRCLTWDPENQLLFSGSFDQSVIVWDIGGKRGTTYELQGHSSSIQGLAHARTAHQLVTGCDDSLLGVWDMKVKRTETPAWAESSVCQKCGSPFFWNVRKMWTDKKVGMRQHHCRRCGHALCHACCHKLSAIPLMGYEHPVRVCDGCFEEITPEQKLPQATFHDMKHSITYIDLDETQKILLTTGSDNVMKIWDMSSVLH
ncbi:hypothetical protein BsWGS_03406 [Bradybaena similaris]